MTERQYERVNGAETTDRQERYAQTGAETVTPPLVDDATREVTHEYVRGPGGTRVVSSEHVSEPSEAVRRGSAVTRAKQVIYFLFGLITVLLIIRFVLLLLGASEASGFVQLMYTLTQPLVAPFFGIFGEPSFGNSVIEWASLVAIIIYTLVAYGIARLVTLIYAPTRPTVS